MILHQWSFEQKEPGGILQCLVCSKTIEIPEELCDTIYDIFGPCTPIPVKELADNIVRMAITAYRMHSDDFDLRRVIQNAEGMLAQFIKEPETDPEAE